MNLKKLFKLGKEEVTTKIADKFISPTTVIKVDLEDLRKQLMASQEGLASAQGVKTTYEDKIKESEKYVQELKIETIKFIEKTEKETDEMIKKSNDLKIERARKNLKARDNDIKIFKSNVESTSIVIAKLQDQIDILKSRIEDVESKEAMAKMKSEFTNQVKGFADIISNPILEADLNNSLDKIDKDYNASTHRLNNIVTDIEEDDILTSISNSNDGGLEDFKKSLLEEKK